MITAEQIKEMIAAEVQRVIREEIKIEYKSSDDALDIDLTLNGEVVSTIQLSKYDLPIQD
ncbi:hypothetical protein ACQ31_gp154 [Salmonella phage STML-198]|uniref:Uncharacterized protein n=2 Tax=Tevenvirinae TaxID=1198136 RepID=K4I424_9CAUD|nr:hypothetical protein ACQ31_gp154 [Salmonella phage STML-198]YP_009618158.1 hypothetical protein FDI95_gp099 [Citrobacter phage CF1 ERZ-2017]AFU64037.1 hypothetical protein [Salmonella phage STML-198]AUE22972.1 hypothetical protein Cf1_00099 [Citrobacter phage CF1 ERZ-2017]